MTTVQQTGSIDLGANNTAAKTATNYITADNSGIRVHNTGDTSDYVQITSDGMDVYNDGTNVARFGSDGTRIGKPYVQNATDNESHMELDYHSMKLMDKDGIVYFHVSDLRDTSGYATIIEIRVGDYWESFDFGIPASEILWITYDTSSHQDPNDYSENTAVSSYTVESYASGLIRGITFDPPLGSPPNDDELSLDQDWFLAVKYRTNSSYAKAFTFGSRDTYPLGGFSATFGERNDAPGLHAFVTGYLSYADGNSAVAQGYNAHASGLGAHAEGNNTTASGPASHSEGSHTTASGIYSHAEGSGTEASGINAHAQNLGTVAASYNQTAIGKWNEEDANGDYALIIGNGTADNARSNAQQVRWDGGIELPSVPIDGDTPSNAAIAIIDPSGHPNSQGANVSSNLYGTMMGVWDDSAGQSGDTNRAHIRFMSFADGKQGIQVETSRRKSDSTYVHNGLQLHIAKDGTRSVTVTESAPWRNALGASSGIWPVSLGGTGLTSSPSMLTNLGSTTAANVLQASPRPGITGTLAVSHGGTGITDFGQVENTSGSNVSVASSAWKQLASFSVAKGDWLIIVGCYAASNSTGRRGWYLGTESSASDVDLSRVNSAVMSATSGTCYTTIVNRVSVSSATTYRVWGWQNSGSALNMSAYIRRIKLG